MFRSRANLGRKRGHRAPAIRPGGTLGLSEAADSDARLFQDSTGRFDVLSCGVWHVTQVVGEGACRGAGCAVTPSPPSLCRATGFSGAVFR